MAARMLPFFSIILFFAPIFILAQSTIPAKYDGFVYGNQAASTDNVIIEAFFDPVCPYSRDAWPPLKRALQHYGHSVSFIVHPFPLPYHDNAFVTSRALHIVNKINKTATYKLLELFFHHQEGLYNKKTFNISKASVVKHVLQFATSAVGKSHHSTLELGFSDRETDLATRSSFKYGCSRGVYGTPTFFVNGMPLPDGDSPNDYKKWRNTIDPLVHKKE